MNSTLLIFGSILFPIIVFVGYRYFSIIQANKGDRSSVFQLISPVLSALDKNQKPDQALIDKLADQPAVRQELYLVLKEFDKTNLLPDKYLNQQAGAESSLVHWLVYENEDGSAPSQIEFVETVAIEDMLQGKHQSFLYYIFQFSMDAPPAKALGWMPGIAGPYLEEDGPYEFVVGTNSNFEVFTAKTPTEHAQWAHDQLKDKVNSSGSVQ